MSRAFVIAMDCEADCIRPWLKPADRLYVCGIGKVNAAAATMKAICEGADEIWNAGLCGGFGDGMEVGDVYAVESAVEYDFDLAQLNGTRIGQLNEFDSPYLPFAKVESPTGLSLASRVLATGDHFRDGTEDHDLIVRELGASLRDMEGAAIAHVCRNAHVPCRSVKCVSDVVGKGSMVGQYEACRAKCLARLSDVMKELMR